MTLWIVEADGEQPMSSIDIMSAQSQTRGYLLDASTSVG